MPILPLADGCPRYDRPQQRPADLDALNAFDPASLPETGDLSAALLALIGTPELASKRWVWTQYDHMVQLVGATRPGEADAAVVRIPGSTKAVAMSSDVNPRYCYLDPRLGGRHAVAEAARNVSCVGAEPLAISDCLNFGNPEKPEIMWQLAEAVAGHRRRLHRARDPGGQWQREPLQRDRGQGDPPHADGGDGRAPRGRRAPRGGRRDRERASRWRSSGPPPATSGARPGSSTSTGSSPGPRRRWTSTWRCGCSGRSRRLVRSGAVGVAHDCAEGGIAVALTELCLTTRHPDDAIVGLDLHRHRRRGGPPRRPPALRRGRLADPGGLRPQVRRRRSPRSPAKRACR